MSAEPTAYPTDAGFDVVRRGYEQEQVDGHLLRLDTELRILGHDRDAAVDQAAQLRRELEAARVRADNLRAQVRSLVGPPNDVQGMSERMRSMLHLAEDEVADMLARARDEAGRTRADAQREADTTLAEARSEADALLDDARSEGAALVDAAQQEAAQLHEETGRQRAEARAEQERVGAELAAAATAAAHDRAQRWADSEGRRREVEQDFAIAMDQRRAEALARLHQDRESAREEAARTREDASTEAQRHLEKTRARAAEMVATAQQEVEELRAVRRRILEQLDSAAAGLTRARAHLGEPGTVASDTVAPDTAPPGTAPAQRRRPSPQARSEPRSPAATRS